ncbi:atp-dependent DNA helicase ddx11-related [Anaeramoeba ignava]|uniref:DNA 5'-3' helicase n=1 Tax=Anaeramoeba ignava TaxID=1746090 RepID=A0A9Q0L8C8_ANAIG|nr:atp-dependent DNA helicase ddx11-related [Anaeramoeba ignava]
MSELKFPFPFQLEPYPIQQQFMEEFYKTVKTGGIGLFESPTGTGKSLSIICAIIKYLEDQNNPTEIEEIQPKNEQPSWVQEFTQKQKISEKKDLLEKQRSVEKKQRDLLFERINQYRKTGYISDQNFPDPKINPITNSKKKRKQSPLDLDQNQEQSPSNNETQNSDPFLLNDTLPTQFSTQNQFDASEIQKDFETENEDIPIIKNQILYCSRTHSQLSQFVNEVKKTTFGNQFFLVVLASRSFMCINSKIRDLNDPILISQKCHELISKSKTKKQRDEDKKEAFSVLTKRSRQRTRSRKSQTTSHLTNHGCPFYDKQKINYFRDEILASPMTVEELVEKGHEIGVCPYYSSRNAIKSSHLVILPYNSLLHSSTRENLGIELTDRVVILDESHNIIETINSLHSVVISYWHAVFGYKQLNNYYWKYKNKLKPMHQIKIQEILQFIKRILRCFNNKSEENENQNENENENIELFPEQQKIQELLENGIPTEKNILEIYSLNDFLFDQIQMDNMNPFELLSYFRQSEITKKVQSFCVNQYSKEKQFLVVQNFGLNQVESFIESLTNTSQNCRILITRSNKKSNSSIKFLLLNPESYFEPIINQTKATFFVGGTIKPFEDFQSQLFPNYDQTKIHTLSCGHVIPPRNIMATCLKCGIKYQDMKLTFEKRNDPGLIEDLGETLLRILVPVPFGAVCFFPSYSYQKIVLKNWKQKGIFKEIEKVKKIFIETKKTNESEKTLEKYREWIDNKNGALLLCVVGGKMSEGINFTDNYARLVIMIGMPYPNPKDPEIIEKIRFWDQKKMDHIKINQEKTNVSNASSGKDYYDNLCMRAVNQSIGRSIRHKNDYAVIMLIDSRYSLQNIQKKLPSWISQSFLVFENVDNTVQEIDRFFQEKRNF